MDDVRAGVAERDGFIGYDDFVMVLFEPVRGSFEFYQFAVNPLGTVFDRMVEICPFGSYVQHPEWDADFDVAVGALEDRWTVEISIPFEVLGNEPDEGSQWGFNLVRRHKRLDASSTFQGWIRYDSDYLGVLRF
jgi:hypothetical protein